MDSDTFRDDGFSTWNQVKYQGTIEALRALDILKQQCHAALPAGKGLR